MKVGIVMGSKSDLPVVKEAVDILKEFEIETETRIISAHRTPVEAEAFSKGAKASGIEVIIAAAGKAAHLAGVMAASTPLPVIGIPMKTSDLGGLDSLLSTVQMPKGVPVATVAIGGGKNAGLLAAQILSLRYPQIMEKIEGFKAKQAEDIRRQDVKLQEELNSI